MTRLHLFETGGEGDRFLEWLRNNAGIGPADIASVIYFPKRLGNKPAGLRGIAPVSSERISETVAPDDLVVVLGDDAETAISTSRLGRCMRTE